MFQRRCFTIFLWAGLMGFGAISVGATASAAERPVTVSPGKASGVAVIETRCPTFSWSLIGEATGYELVTYLLAEEVGKEKPVLQEKLSGSVSAWTPSLDRCLERGGQYAWSVRAVGRKGNSDWSSPSLFQVAAGPTQAELDEALAVVRRFLANQDGREFGAETEMEADKARAVARPGPPEPSGAAAVGDIGLFVDLAVEAAGFKTDGTVEAADVVAGGGEFSGTVMGAGSTALEVNALVGVFGPVDFPSGVGELTGPSGGPLAVGSNGIEALGHGVVNFPFGVGPLYGAAGGPLEVFHLSGPGGSPIEIGANGITGPSGGPVLVGIDGIAGPGGGAVKMNEVSGPGGGALVVSNGIVQHGNAPVVFPFGVGNLFSAGGTVLAVAPLVGIGGGAVEFPSGVEPLYGGGGGPLEVFQIRGPANTPVEVSSLGIKGPGTAALTVMGQIRGFNGYLELSPDGIRGPGGGPVGGPGGGPLIVNSIIGPSGGDISLGAVSALFGPSGGPIVVPSGISGYTPGPHTVDTDSYCGSQACDGTSFSNVDAVALGGIAAASFTPGPHTNDKRLGTAVCDSCAAAPNPGCTALCELLQPFNPATFNQCYGRIRDSGGASINYGPNENRLLTVCSPDGAAIDVSFSSFHTEEDVDLLHVLDGPGIPTNRCPANGSPPIPAAGQTFLDTFSGAGSPGSRLGNGCLTFLFCSDGSTQFSGWEATISCP